MCVEGHQYSVRSKRGPLVCRTSQFYNVLYTNGLHNAAIAYAEARCLVPHTKSLCCVVHRDGDPVLYAKGLFCAVRGGSMLCHILKALRGAVGQRPVL